MDMHPIAYSTVWSKRKHLGLSYWPAPAGSDTLQQPSNISACGVPVRRHTLSRYAIIIWPVRAGSDLTPGSQTQFHAQKGDVVEHFPVSKSCEATWREYTDLHRSGACNATTELSSTTAMRSINANRTLYTVLWSSKGACCRHFVYRGGTSSSANTLLRDVGLVCLG